MSGPKSVKAVERKSLSRVPAKPLDGRGARMPAYDHPALMDGRTIYPTTVRGAGEVNRALKSGYNNGKLGAVVLKGRWKSFPVFSLTLEERTTCPRGCRHWRSCYGNSMHLAERVAAGPELERVLEQEIEELATSHPDGFVVRLHILGDFYSVGYVRFWERMLDRFGPLNAFGYTARWDGRDDPIARALHDMAERRWDRFAIRFSNSPLSNPSTVSVEHPFQVPPDAILCPVQVGRSESCTTCALCWQSKRRIAFLQH